ncbi:putative signal peptide protein [Puccinia sorghi]|uniref:Putative signal peptide protein n=1 Tax=Puccinia sorghi TaxID=27349 RepID=A0A0L6UB77_9BASI|nr:putative signal peptide protein [Puccinia sorghi]
MTPKWGVAASAQAALVVLLATRAAVAVTCPGCRGPNVIQATVGRGCGVSITCPDRHIHGTCQNQLHVSVISCQDCQRNWGAPFICDEDGNGHRLMTCPTKR